MKHAATNAAQWMFRKNRDAFLTFTTPTLVEEETCETGPDDFTVQGFTTGAYDAFEAPCHLQSQTKRQANRPTFSEAVKYLKIKNIWRDWLLGTSPTLVLKVFQVCGIVWVKAKCLRNDGIILDFQMNDPEVDTQSVLDRSASECFHPWHNAITSFSTPHRQAFRIRMRENHEERLPFHHSSIYHITYTLTPPMQDHQDRSIDDVCTPEFSIPLINFNILDSRHSLKARSECTDANEEDPLKWDYTFEH
ncbi:hypothetical protein BTUL_0033g00240 [Botrytis tulipae]|uniref:Uncharacterized protein n=1 Tax=Botrytis tulipae TaxID=87230 RepID=A0A4Z1EUW1_9HELO|nr:hypothetical protein BTUL_0033g00240 [Botrytis tulipae]